MQIVKENQPSPNPPLRDPLTPSLPTMNQKSVESGVQAVFKKIILSAKSIDSDFKNSAKALDDIEQYIAVARVLSEMAPPKKQKKKLNKKRKIEEVGIKPIVVVSP